MGVIAGINGLLNGVALFQQFSVTSTADLKELVHAGTGIGGKQRIIGVKDWNGTYNSYGHTPEFFPGDVLTFLGSIDGLVGLSGPALVTQQVITIPVGSNDPPSHVGSFRGTGALLRTDAVVVEPSASIPPGSAGICVKLADIDTDGADIDFTSEDNTHNIVITLSIEEKEYVDCSTNGLMSIIEGGWDASVNYDRYVDDFADLPEEGSPHYVRVPTTSVGDVFYEFQYMRVGELSNMQVNRETGDLVGASVPLLMSTIETAGASPAVALGEGVILPSTSVWRPEAPSAMAVRRKTLFTQAAERMSVLATEGRVSQAVAKSAVDRLEENLPHLEKLIAIKDKKKEQTAVTTETPKE